RRTPRDDGPRPDELRTVEGSRSLLVLGLGAARRGGGSRVAGGVRVGRAKGAGTTAAAVAAALASARGRAPRDPRDFGRHGRAHLLRFPVLPATPRAHPAPDEWSVRTLRRGAGMHERRNGPAGGAARSAARPRGGAGARGGGVRAGRPHGRRAGDVGRCRAPRVAGRRGPGP